MVGDHRMMRRTKKNAMGIHGYGWWELLDPPDPLDPESWEHGERIAYGRFHNLITQFGDQFYGERSVGIGTHVAPSGMQLGTNTAASAKTGTGSKIETYVSGSSVIFTATWPQSSLVSGSRQIQFKTGWGPGVAQNAALAEVAIINQAIGTDSAAPSTNVIARARLNPTVDKSNASAILVVTWNHLLLGA